MTKPIRRIDTIYDEEDRIVYNEREFVVPIEVREHIDVLLTSAAITDQTWSFIAKQIDEDTCCLFYDFNCKESFRLKLVFDKGQFTELVIRRSKIEAAPNGRGYTQILYDVFSSKDVNFETIFEATIKML